MLISGLQRQHRVFDGLAPQHMFRTRHGEGGEGWGVTEVATRLSPPGREDPRAATPDRPDAGACFNRPPILRRPSIEERRRGIKEAGGGGC